MHNKILSLLLVMALMPVNISLAAVTNVFSDVAGTNENRDAIDYVHSAKIVQGYSDGTYQPNRKINRAEFTKIIIAAQFSEAEIDRCLLDTTAPFPDTPKNEWFTPFVCVAVQKGIIGGYPDGTFKPSRDLSFAEAAKIIANAFGASVSTDNEIWYRPYVKHLSANQAIPVSVARFEHVITRGEMAEMIYRLKKNIVNKASHTFESLSGEIELQQQDTQAPTTQINYEGELLAGNKTKLLNFVQADLEKALEANKFIVLYFYANWCPLCRAEQPDLEGAFNELSNDNIVGFRVNYNDSDTDTDEENLAREHGVAYQHTKVFIKNGERILKSPATWDKARYLQEIGDNI